MWEADVKSDLACMFVWIAPLIIVYIPLYGVHFVSDSEEIYCHAYLLSNQKTDVDVDVL